MRSVSISTGSNAGTSTLSVVFLAVHFGVSLCIVPITADAEQSAPAPPEPSPAQPLPPPDTPPPMPVEADPSVWLGVLIHGGIDIWSRGTIGTGFRLEVPVLSWLQLETSLQYGATPLFTSPASEEGENLVIEDSLRGFLHATELTIGAGVRLFERRVSMLVRVGLGAAIVATSAAVGETDASGSSWRMTGTVSIGAGFNLDGWRVGVEAGVRGVFLSSSGAWAEAPMRVFLEVNGVMGLGR